MSLPKMLTINEAAQLSRELQIGISKYHIRILCNEGKIPCCKIGVKTLLNWDGLMEYLENLPISQPPQAGKIRPVPNRFTA